MAKSEETEVLEDDPAAIRARAQEKIQQAPSVVKMRQMREAAAEKALAEERAEKEESTAQFQLDRIQRKVLDKLQAERKVELGLSPDASHHELHEALMRDYREKVTSDPTYPLFNKTLHRASSAPASAMAFKELNRLWEQARAEAEGIRQQELMARYPRKGDLRREAVERARTIQSLQRALDEIIAE